MANTKLKEGFSFQDLFDSLTFIDSNGAIHEPLAYNEQGQPIGSQQAIQALQNGEGICLREITPRDKSNRVIFCAKKDNGNLNISDPIETDLKKLREAPKSLPSKPSDGRMRAYKLFGWIGFVKKHILYDVAGYETVCKEIKKIEEESIGKLKQSWKEHAENGTIANFETLDGQNEAVRALKLHAKKKNDECLNASAKSNFEEEFPGVDNQALTESQRNILRGGLLVKSEMFRELATQEKSKTLDIRSEDLAMIAEAQFVQKLIIDVKNNNNLAAKALLNMLEDPENEARFRAELASRLNGKYKVEDVSMLLETEEGAAIFSEAAKASVTKVDVISTDPEKPMAAPKPEMARPVVRKIKQVETEELLPPQEMVMPGGNIK